MKKYLIILGSDYQESIEYYLPEIIDEKSEWVVYSIDIIPNDESKKLISNNLITVNRINMNIIELVNQDFISEIKDSTVYLIDSVSCGFITETSKNLVKIFNDNKNIIYFNHYISPKNIDSSHLTNEFKIDNLLNTDFNYIVDASPLLKSKDNSIAIDKVKKAISFYYNVNIKNNDKLSNFVKLCQEWFQLMMNNNIDKEIKWKVYNQFINDVNLIDILSIKFKIVVDGFIEVTSYCTAKNNFKVGSFEIKISIIKYIFKSIVIVLIIFLFILLLIYLVEIIPYKNYKDTTNSS